MQETMKSRKIYSSFFVRCFQAPPMAKWEFEIKQVKSKVRERCRPLGNKSLIEPTSQHKKRGKLKPEKFIKILLCILLLIQVLKFIKKLRWACKMLKPFELLFTFICHDLIKSAPHPHSRLKTGPLFTQAFVPIAGLR